MLIQNCFLNALEGVTTPYRENFQQKIFVHFKNYFEIALAP